MVKVYKCRYCGKMPIIKYIPGVMEFRALCPTIGCANHKRIFPIDSSKEGAILAWNRYSTQKRRKT